MSQQTRSFECYRESLLDVGARSFIYSLTRLHNLRRSGLFHKASDEIIDKRYQVQKKSRNTTNVLFDIQQIKE